MGPLQVRFYSLLNERHPMMSRGVAEARDVAPAIVDKYFENALEWLVRSYGEQALVHVADGYARFTIEVNQAQRAYEASGRYEYSSFADANRLVYQQAEYMQNYYWGVFAILFCWSHYVELMELYLERFVQRLPAGRLIEIAPGHGAWGVLAVTSNPALMLEGWDISPTSLTMATKMAEGAGVMERCKYRNADATRLQHEDGRFDAAVCNFMLEHLEQPGQFLADFAPSLKPGATAFISLALTAAQTDHIYEFRRESEAIVMAEEAGFELIESRVARPRRLMPGARFVPRVQAMLLRKV
jgi:2-polyprenyl-3-methyl-5-hydroxy-6-metoxy-1,4-benzoquinol methylase